MQRKRQGRRDFGCIIEHGPSSFSVTWAEGRLRRRKRGFESRGEAASFLAKTRVDLETGAREIGDAVVVAGVTVSHAIEAYGKRLAERGLKAYGNAERLRRLRTFFSDQEAQLVDLTRARCQRYYDALRAAVSRATKRPYSVDTCRNTLAEARMLLKFAIGKSWLRTSPLDGVEAHGKRRHGKEQLRLDEARRWLCKAVELADAGDAGAVAAMMALLLGMRASEITTRVVRDLDDDGKVLVIPESKTRAGRRQLQIPDLLQPHLQRLAANKPPEARIFGTHWRDWIRKSVMRVCELAEVPLVCAHSMRGLNASLAVAAGATGHLVAASLGHESQTTTFQSYADPAAVAGAQQRRTLTVLAGGAG